jgi:RNA polymerase sigma-70 factor (ECF subfamily)
MTVTMAAPLGMTAPRRSRNDELLMESVHATHSRSLLRFLLGLTRNERTAAEDLLQETMIRVWRHLESLPGEEENARKWLFTIARRVAIDAARSRQARPSEVSLMEADQITGADTAEGMLALHDLTDAFQKLSGEHRMVLQELHFRGASIEEAAQRLGVPAGTVKSRAHYAMRILRAALNPAEQSG